MSSESHTIDYDINVNITSINKVMRDLGQIAHDLDHIIGLWPGCGDLRELYQLVLKLLITVRTIKRIMELIQTASALGASAGLLAKISAWLHPLLLLIGVSISVAGGIADRDRYLAQRGRMGR